MSNLEMEGLGTRIVETPVPSDPRLQSTILDVVCGRDENVEWHWTVAQQGRFVSGYSIVRRDEALDRFGAAAAATAAHRQRSRKDFVAAPHRRTSR